MEDSLRKIMDVKARAEDLGRCEPPEAAPSTQSDRDEDPKPFEAVHMEPGWEPV